MLGRYILSDLNVCLAVGANLEEASAVASVAHARLGLQRAAAALFAVLQSDPALRAQVGTLHCSWCDAKRMLQVEH